MSLCLLAGGKTLALAISAFSLSWTHSVQKTEWRERWEVTPAGLILAEAAVKGSGAGMEPGPDAVLRDGWWVWAPKLAAQPRIVLAASGATGGGWRLCHDAGCLEVGTEAGKPAVIEPCDDPGDDKATPSSP